MLIAVTEVTWPGVVQAFVGNLPATITAVAALITAIAAIQKINSVHKDVNSRMDQLLKSSGESQHAAGVKEGEANKISGNPVVIDEVVVKKLVTPPDPTLPKNGPQL